MITKNRIHCGTVVYLWKETILFPRNPNNSNLAENFVFDFSGKNLAGNAHGEAKIQISQKYSCFKHGESPRMIFSWSISFNFLLLIWTLEFTVITQHCNIDSITLDTVWEKIN